MIASSGPRERDHSHHSPGLWMLGGLLVVISMGLPWFTYHVVNPTPQNDSLTGAALFGAIPEVGIAAALGLTLVIYASAAWRHNNRKLLHTTLPRVGHTLCSVALFVLSIEAVWRFSSTSLALYHAAIWNSLGVGWEVAMAGAALALLGSLADWILPPSFLTERATAPG